MTVKYKADHMTRTGKRLQGKASYLGAFVVAVLTFLVYIPTLQNSFVNWDDDLYLYANYHLRSIDKQFFSCAFFDFYASNWHPLTWVSHAIDYALWGLNPFGHHLTSVLIHSANTFLVVLLAIRLLQSANKITPDSRPTGEMTLHSGILLPA